MSATRRPKVLLIETMYHPDGEALLRERAEVHIVSDASESELMAAIADADAAIVRYPAKLRAPVLRVARRLLIASTSGRGTDSIDINEATEQGIAVVNNPGLGKVPVSEHTLALILDLAKEVTRDDVRARRRRQEGWDDRHLSRRIELEGSTLGVIGLGSIGREVARKCSAAFNMRVIGYDPYVPSEDVSELGVTMVPELADLLREADVVTCHPELNAETRGMIGEEQLRQMKPDAILVNTSRGPVVQQAALVKALTEGWIRGAALDVYESEPPTVDSPLYDLDNLIVTPHTAGLTALARRELAISAATQVLQVLNGERPPYLLNPEVWEDVAVRVKAQG
jgi:D-3-phosphoglycerate dehydrogenase/microcystin synthetase protein McyI